MSTYFVVENKTLNFTSHFHSSSTLQQCLKVLLPPIRLQHFSDLLQDKSQTPERGFHDTSALIGE